MKCFQHGKIYIHFSRRGKIFCNPFYVCILPYSTHFPSWHMHPHSTQRLKQRERTACPRKRDHMHLNKNKFIFMLVIINNFHPVNNGDQQTKKIVKNQYYLQLAGDDVGYTGNKLLSSKQFNLCLLLCLKEKKYFFLNLLTIISLLFIFIKLIIIFLFLIYTFYLTGKMYPNLRKSLHWITFLLFQSKLLLEFVATGDWIISHIDEGFAVGEVPKIKHTSPGSSPQTIFVAQPLPENPLLLSLSITSTDGKSEVMFGIWTCLHVNRRTSVFF